MARQLLFPPWERDPNYGRTLVLRSYDFDIRQFCMENSLKDIAADTDSRIIEVFVEVPMPLNHINITLNVTQSPQQLELPLT